MDSSFTLTIDWLAFTVLATNPQETMKVLGGDWSKAKGGFRGYPLSWMRADGLRGVGKLGTNAPRRPNEIHVDLSGGLASALTLDQIRTLLKWVHAQQGHVTRIDCALDDRAGTVPVSTIREAVSASQCVTRAAQVRQYRLQSLVLDAQTGWERGRHDRTRSDPNPAQVGALSRDM
jgi:phage replication initiation protein